MKTLFTGLAVLLLSTALVACGGANSSSEKGKGGEADSNQDDDKNGGGGDGPTPTDRTNPLTKGKFPTERTAFYVGNTTGSEAVLTVDPKAGTFTYVFTPIKGSQDDQSDEGTIEGTYDDFNGTMTVEKCTGNFAARCELFSDYNAYPDYLLGMPFGPYILGSGDDYVVLTENLTNEGYFGVSPTDADAMPSSGNVTYSGQFYSGYVYQNGDEESDVDTDLRGDATTRVNFETGKLEADFSNFHTIDDNEMSAEIRDVTIDGNRFSGGQGRVSHPNGALMAFTDVRKLDGQFFGPNGEELGGTFDWQLAGEDDDESVEFFGSWIGTAD